MRKIILMALSIAAVGAFSSLAPAAPRPDGSGGTLTCRRKGAVCTKAEQCCSTACYQGGDTVAHCQ